MTDLLKELADAEAEAAQRVRLEKRPKPQFGYRNMYAVMIDGVYRGFVAMRNGWGGRWDYLNIYQRRPQSAFLPFIYDKEGAPRRILEAYTKYPNESFWRSVEEIEAAESKKKEEAEQREQAWKKAAEERREKNAATLEGLISLRDNHDSRRYTNQEFAAIVAAIDYFKGQVG
ncbi:hypothetical protein KEU06_09225 [Pseudaminobacter sp. 19-2017]|uniref:Uncharacterized protein n=1 Tax=Pseudaminobacter soli (ex Zhang et al. 2022) TaxID=2831468 RepID=A0A942I7W6_9HYPH|nr:hypothetical protein [Pseudaminobacter soli]MBS3648785.1 hypothetical protein [Pseudaminobacter soli]